MPLRQILLVGISLLLMLGGADRLCGQYKTKKQHVSPTLIIDQSDLIYDLLESFDLVRKANDGDPRAQHELGIRYFVGRGFQADTVKAFLWISRAAARDFLRAHYNLGVFYNNGWGTPWNPFQGYRHFRIAAERNMPEAEYTVALILTEDLVVPRDLDEAERWLTKAANQGLEPAKSALRELHEQRREQERAQRSDSAAASAIGLQDTTGFKIPSFMFLEEQSDSLSDIENPENLERLFRDRGPQLMKALGIPEEAIDTTKRGPPPEQLIQKTANLGSPEARILLGRCYELGRGCPQDHLRAAIHYLGAVRLDSPKAARLLWELTRNSDILSVSSQRAKAGDNDARFVLSGLAALRLDVPITDEQSAQLLEQAGQQDHVESLLELGVRYSSGRTVSQDRDKAIELWQRAAALGSREADVRLAASKIFGSSAEDPSGLLKALFAYASEGSSLAEAALAYCYESGFGVPSNTAEAVRHYRRAAGRGSETAYLALRRLYDEIRPEDREFQIDEF